MNLAALDLNLLLVFEAIAAERSVSKAAERLGMRQPAVSAALARLRFAFGDNLFVRAGGAMQPTPRANRLSVSVSLALGELRGAMIDVPFAPMVAERTFKIASTDYTTLVILPQVMAAISREARGVDVRVIGYDKSDIPDLLDRGEIDVALGVFRQPSERAVQQFLCPEHFVGMARAGHPLVKNGTLSLDDYAAASHALVSVRRDAIGEIDEELAAIGRSRRIAMTLPHMLVLPAVLSATDLIAAVPSRIAAVALDKRLQSFQLPLKLPPWRIEMLWNPSTRTDPASIWLRSKIVDAASSYVTAPPGSKRTKNSPRNK